MTHVKEGKKEIEEIITSYNDIFLLGDDPLPLTELTQHEIWMENQNPIHTKQYRHPQMHQEEIKKEVKDMLRLGIIKYSTSPWNSPIWVVPKKRTS